MRVTRMNSVIITRYFAFWMICTGYGPRNAEGKPDGMQNARGSSCRGSPVRGSKNGSPLALSGGNFVRSKTVAGPRADGGFGLSHMPEKSGLPSAVRGMALVDFVACCARATQDIKTSNNGITRFIKTPLVF